MTNNKTNLSRASQLSLIPLSDNELVEIIRPDENLERWSNFLFPHPRTKGLDKKRERVWNPVLDHRKDVEASISIVPSVEALCYTCRSYDVYLALLAIWDEQGRSEDPFSTSIRRIADRMEISPSGKHLNMIQDELQTLYDTRISWRYSYITSEGVNETVKNQRILSVFDFSRIEERSNNKDRFEAVCYLKFDDKILANLRGQATIPVNWTERKAITSPIAKVLYNMIDNILTKHPAHSRTATNIVNELGLTKDRYKYKSQRKALLDKVKNQLHGRRLSDLKIISVAIVETADKEDWKCIFRSDSDRKAKSKRNITVANIDETTIDYLANEIASVVGKEEENINLYLLFAKHYSENAIYRALGEYKESIANSSVPIKNKQKYFTSIMHAVAHKLKLEWIKPCSSSCRYRPENRLEI